MVILALKASFSNGLMLIVTLGWAAMYSLAIWSHTGFMGSMFWMCHQSMTTFSCAACPPAAGASSPPDPQPASSSAARRRRHHCASVNDISVVPSVPECTARNFR